MSLAESVVEPIILELVHECTTEDALSEDMIALKLRMGTLPATCSPSLDTIKMQVYFDINYTSRRE
uniref:Uncharacterized protein n=2 Tax=Hippocampus comes TaxID=109280 RepID=A0A3Q2YAC3_HIPCM